MTQISIIANAHPLAAGLTGNVAVYNAPGWRIVWGIPGSGSVNIATVMGVPTQITIFAYPTGSTMVGGNAPGKRLGFFIHNTAAATSPANVSAAGLQLLDAAIDWMIAP